MKTEEFVIQQYFIRQWDDAEVFGNEQEARMIFRTTLNANRPHRLIKRTVEVLAQAETHKTTIY